MTNSGNCFRDKNKPGTTSMIAPSLQFMISRKKETDANRPKTTTSPSTIQNCIKTFNSPLDVLYEPLRPKLVEPILDGELPLPSSLGESEMCIKH